MNAKNSTLEAPAQKEMIVGGASMNGYATYEEIISEFSFEHKNRVIPEKNAFGYWMQTLADVQFLDLELSGLSADYNIDSIKRTVQFGTGEDLSFIRRRVAHLDLINGEPTLYSEITDWFEDTNAYAFHNLYPYKGKYYPRLVRAIANAFRLDKGDTVLDPFNGCGTTTHECGIMGIKSMGIDINPIGNMIANLKDKLLFAHEGFKSITSGSLEDIFESLKAKKRIVKDDIIYQLLLLVYFDTIDAFDRTSRYNKKGEVGLFVEKFTYIADCYLKLKKFLKDKDLVYEQATIKEGSATDLGEIPDGSIDAVITSPPYYFSLDYVGKDKIAYNYLNSVNFFDYEMDAVKNEYLGMKTKSDLQASKLLDKKVITYFIDLEKSVEEIVRVTKPKGKVAIVTGNSSLNGNVLPTTEKTHQFCVNYGLKHLRTVFNPLLGSRNRAIRGESVLLYEKQ